MKLENFFLRRYRQCPTTFYVFYYGGVPLYISKHWFNECDMLRKFLGQDKLFGTKQVKHFNDFYDTYFRYVQ